ncbi:hypothetical protein EB796_001604 [Bugula neritina]|uniref:Uncharacterized protein n=1 Tax=Bugula neritina TaxID=10212 RepID=A0A7J7KPH2_BUGNE|nr:hypothetical protein EB796_001604 [Bugula neritina]
MVSMTSKPSRDMVKQIESKLEKCRNQEFNPNNEAFQRKMRDLEEDDDMQQLQLYQQNSDEQIQMEEDIITTNG